MEKQYKEKLTVLMVHWHVKQWIVDCRGSDWDPHLHDSVNPCEAQSNIRKKMQMMLY